MHASGNASEQKRGPAIPIPDVRLCKGDAGGATSLPSVAHTRSSKPTRWVSWARFGLSLVLKSKVGPNTACGMSNVKGRARLNYREPEEYSSVKKRMGMF